MKKPFMEMDLDDFDEVSSDNGLDFDFDDDEVSTPDKNQSSNITNKKDISDEYKAYLADVETYKKNPSEIVNKLKELIAPKTLPDDFINGVDIFATNDYSNAIISKDGNVIYCVDDMYIVPQIIRTYKNEDGVLDRDLLPLSNDGYGNEIVLRLSDGTYHVYYHDRFKDGKNIMIQIASSFDELLKSLKSDETTQSSTKESDLDNTEVNQESFVQEAWDPYTIDEAKNELKKWRNVYLNLDSWKRNYDIKKIEPEFDKLEKEVLSKMKTTHDLLRVEHGNFYLYPKSWKGSTYGDGKKLDDFEYVMKVSGVHDEEPHFLYDKYDPDGKYITESFVQEAFGSTLAKEWIKKPEVTQEGMFDAGFGNLRSRLADALKDKFKVTNVGPGGIGGNSKFEIMEPDAKFDSMKTTVESTGTGCKVVTRGGGKFKCNFMNIPLSQAFDKIKALFDKPELLLENALYNISRFDNRIYQESDEDEDEIPELPEELDINDDDTSTDDAKEESDTTEKDDETKDDSDDEDSGDDKEQFLTYEELDKNFGSDDSDVQNDYDPNDIEILNKLISGESEAINDYFDGSKDSKDENLRTLFSDIGHEERFHLEQLLYAKSQLTGEKYEPRDPQVKAEYEELINGGMDEESAAFTAMDKASMLGEDDGDDSDMEELEQESAIVYNMLYHNEVMTSICEQHVSNPINTDNNIAVFVEGYIMESIDNVGSAPKSKTDIKSPFAILANGLKLAITGISKMSTVARDAMRRSNLKRTRRKEWLQNHGIGDLFKGGVHLYLWNDKTSQMDFDTPCKYVDFLYRLTKAIGESCGVKLTAAAQHKTIQNPIKFKTVDDGMYALSQVLFTKTKVVVTEENKAALQNEFFGYSDSKINVKVTHDDSGQAVNDSNNIYNKMEAMLLVIQRYTEISKAVLDELAKLEGDVNSVYYKNRPVYNKARTNMSKVINKYNQFISAIAADMTQIIKLNNGLLEMTRERDMTEQSGGKWEGPDVRVSPKTQPQGTKYTKVKKR